MSSASLNLDLLHKSSIDRETADATQRLFKIGERMHTIQVRRNYASKTDREKMV